MLSIKSLLVLQFVLHFDVDYHTQQLTTMEYEWLWEGVSIGLIDNYEV